MLKQRIGRLEEAFKPERPFRFEIVVMQDGETPEEAKARAIRERPGIDARRLIAMSPQDAEVL